jgi:hypothetical protein
VIKLTAEQENLALVEAYIRFRKLKRPYGYILPHYAAEIGKSVHDVNELDVKRFLTKHSMTNASWNTYLSTIRKFHSWLLNRHKRLPVKQWKPPEFFHMIPWKNVEYNSYFASGRDESRVPSVEDLFAVLADSLTIKMLKLAEKGFRPRTGHGYVGNLKMTKKQYNLRLRKLVLTGLIERRKGIYLLTTMGKIVDKVILTNLATLAAEEKLLKLKS